MKETEVKQAGQRLPILQKMELLVKSTANFPRLIEAAETNSFISKLEKDTILKQFEQKEDQLRAFYLLLNSKALSSVDLLTLVNSTGNESLASVFHEQKNLSGSSSEADEGLRGERNEWARLQKIIVDNIDRLSSHTRNLGLVLCFASGIGLISGKDREMIANHSTLEIEQLNFFYSTVSKKGEDAYEKLLKVLKMTNNNWALDVLQIK